MEHIKPGIAGGLSTLAWYPLYGLAKRREASLIDPKFDVKLSTIKKLYLGISPILLTSVTGYTICSIINKQYQHKNPLLVAAGSGLVTGTVVTPLVCINSNQIKRGIVCPIDVAKLMVKEGGYSSFTRGIAPLVTRATIFGTTMFGVRKVMEDELLKRNYSSNASYFASSTGAAIISVLFTQWVDILSTRMEMDPKRTRYPTLLSTARQVTNQLGYKGFFTRAFARRSLQNLVEFYAFPLFLRLL